MSKILNLTDSEDIKTFAFLIFKIEAGTDKERA